MPVLVLGVAANGLAVGHVRLGQHDVHAEALAEPLDHDLELQVAHAQHQGLVGARLVDAGERGILFVQTRQPLHHLLFVALVLAADAFRRRRPGEVGRGQHHGARLGRERVPGVGLAELDRGHHVPGRGPLAVEALLADHVVERAQLLGPAARGVHRFHPRLEVAGEDADQRQVAEMLLGQGLIDQCGKRLVAVGRAADLAVAVGRARDLGAHVERRRQHVHDLVEHLADAEIAVGGAAEHRREVALHDALAEPLADVLDRQLPAADEFLHQLLVAGGRLLHEERAGLGGRGRQLVGDRHLLAVLLHAAALEQVRLVLDEVHDAAERLGFADRQLGRHRVEAEAIVQGLERVAEARVLLVHHVDHRERGGLLLLEDLPHDFGPDLDAGVGADDEERRVRHPQRAVHVADEIEVSRGVDQVDLVSLPLELRESEVDGHLALDLVGAVIEHGASVRHAPEAGIGLGEEQHGLGQRGLAHAMMGDEGDVADLLGAVFLQSAPPRRRWVGEAGATPVGRVSAERDTHVRLCKRKS